MQLPLAGKSVSRASLWGRIRNSSLNLLKYLLNIQVAMLSRQLDKWVWSLKEKAWLEL